MEAGATFGWERYADESIGIDTFGTSAPGDVAMDFFGFTATNVVGDRAGGAGRMTSLRELYSAQGQSPWLDNVRRDWLETGRCAASSTAASGASPPTRRSSPRRSWPPTATTPSWPTLGDESADDAFVSLAGKDISDTAALLAPTFEEAEGADGFVSFEVSPRPRARH